MTDENNNESKKADAVTKATVKGLLVEEKKTPTYPTTYPGYYGGYGGEDWGGYAPRRTSYDDVPRRRFDDDVPSFTDDEDIPLFLRKDEKKAQPKPLPPAQRQGAGFAPKVSPLRERGVFEIARNVDRLRGVAQENLDDRERLATLAFTIWCDVMDGTGLVMRSEDMQAVKAAVKKAMADAIKL